MKLKISKFGDKGLHIYIPKTSEFKEGDEVYIGQGSSYVELSLTIQERLKQFSQEGDTVEDTIRRLIDIYEIDKESSRVTTEEDLNKQGIFVKDIVGIEGNTLVLAKQNGTWKYKIKDEVSQVTIDLLEQRQKENWSPLARACFKQINDKLLTLVEIKL